jgi:DNA-directed RNA polymerase specialized sigma24 family protein
MVFELLVTSGVLVLFRLCRELLTERARRATICRVARTLDRGGLVLDFAIACRATDYLKLSSRTVAGDDADLARLGRPLTADLPDGVLLIEGEQLVLQALSQLPPVQRAVFALICDDYSIADIAAVLKLKEVTARSHLRHARSTLRTWWSSRTTEDHERGRP